ncbi:HEAT repeat domain-containing protein [Halorussus salinisoli]|uniref:HEAT repeat domain-containing protein n=1 Tax=Halorussus salinisoli TaxID=2558242 RepID=UPI0010C1D216|nr:HEAT repeat domain-containing protein [Halorussus salinisoli]
MSTDDESEPVENAELVKRARESPTRVAIDDALALLPESNSEDSEAVISAVAAVIKAHPDDADRAVSQLRSFLAADDSSLRSAAATTVGYVASQRPELVASAVPELVERLDDSEPLPRINATRALSELAAHRPEAVATGRSSLGSLLDSDFPNVRIHSARCLAAIARVAPSEVAPLVSDLVACATDMAATTPLGAQGPDGVDDGDPGRSQVVAEHSTTARDQSVLVQTLAAESLTAVAQQQPEAIPYDRRYLAVLSTDAPLPIRRGAVAALEAVARTNPERGRPAIEPLADLLIEDRDEVLQGRAAMALAFLADSYFEETTAAVRPGASTLCSLLTVDDPEVLSGATGLFTYFAEQYPADVADATPVLRSLLGNDAPSIRARAAFALGFVGDTAERGVLLDVRESDPSEEVREAAAAAIQTIRERNETA